MSGPPKTPTHLALVKGNPSKRPINKNEPKPRQGPPNTEAFRQAGEVLVQAYW